MSSLSSVMLSAYLFEWKIDKELSLAKGISAKSDPFYAGTDKESTWQMSFYPKGSFNSSTEYAAVSLQMVHGLLVKASSKLALLIGDKIMAEKSLCGEVYYENEELFLHSFVKVTDISYPLLLRCKLRIAEENRTLPYNKRAVDINRLLTDIHSLLSQQKATDVLIITRDQKEFRAHKSVLAARSDVFLAMFQCSMSENLEGKLEISDMDGSDVKEMLEYIYSGDLTKWSLRLCMNLFTAGDKYQINTLKNTCSMYIQQNINVEESANILVLADKHGDKNLKEVALQFIRINKKEVLQTHGWKTMVQEQQHLIDDLVLFMK